MCIRDRCDRATPCGQICLSSSTPWQHEKFLDHFQVHPPPHHSSGEGFTFILILPTAQGFMFGLAPFATSPHRHPGASALGLRDVELADDLTKLTRAPTRK